MKIKAALFALLFLTAALFGCAGKINEANSLDTGDVSSGIGFGLFPSGEDAAAWTLADFPDCFDTEWETLREKSLLMEGLEVTILHGAEDGPAVYVVAGIHGDEIAGWHAGNLLKGICLRAGMLYIISPANTYGAEHNQRKTTGEHDLNRSFPGNADGSAAERIAAAIFSDIERRQPVLLLDLHEAHRSSGSGTDALGNSIICGSFDGIGELIWEILLASETGGLCTSPLTLYSSPPEGSINRTASEKLGIPAVTVETLRTEPLAQRVRNQLEIVQYALQYENML